MFTVMLKFRPLPYLLFFLCLFCSLVFADTLIYKNGEKEKGLVIESFKDRIVFSTIKGETIVMKDDIKAVVYDSPDRVLVQKGKNQLRKKQYIKAYYTFEEAVSLDPENIEADTYMRHMRNLAETKIRSDVINRIITRKEKSSETGAQDPVEEVKDRTGLVLSGGKEYVVVSGVINNGIRGQLSEVLPGDRIVSVWGEKTAYMDESEVAERLIFPGEVRIKIERDVAVRISDKTGFFDRFLPFRYGRLIGAVLEHDRSGLRVEKVYADGPFDTAGIREGDILYYIGNRNTRYLDKYQLEEILKSGRGSEIKIAIRRDIIFWNKGKMYD